MLASLLFVVHFIPMISCAFTCDELASFISNTCLDHLIETKGYINVNNEGNLNPYADNKIGYREYYHDSISSTDSKNLIAILLVHGGPSCPSIYLDTMKYLSCTATYRVIFYDQLCVGMSSNTVNKKCNNISANLPSLFTMRYYSNEMYSIIQNRVQLQSNVKFHLLGQSAGGLLVTQFAVHNINYVNSGDILSIIYANSVTHSMPQYLAGMKNEILPSLPRKYSEIMLNLEFDNPHFEEANHFFEMKNMVGLYEFPDCVLEGLNGWVFEIYSNIFAKCEWCPATGAMGVLDLSDEIKNIKVPVFAYRGGNDYIVQNILTQFQQKATGTNVTLYTIDNAAHLSHIDHFDEWYEMMMQWLTGGQVQWYTYEKHEL